MAVYKSLGLPLHLGKCLCSSIVLVVRDIELDSVNQVASLPAKKLLTLKELITSWLTRKSKQSLFPFAVSWASYILQRPLAQKMNGYFAFSSLILARTIQHSSIKVYLSGIRALHIQQGFPDPFMNFLRLQRAVRDIKRCQGSSSSNQLLITDDLMLVIWRSLDLHPPDQQDP